MGFHTRAETLDADCSFRPDGYYGLSKAYGELMGRLYWDKHGVSSVFLRIGSATAKPVAARMLATWLSYPDRVRLVERSVLAPVDGCFVVWGASANARMTWWRGDDRQALGWAPQDSADTFTTELAGKTSADPVVEQHAGGAYCRIDYTR